MTDIPATFSIFRPPGLPLAGLVAVPFGLGDTTVRIVAAAGGLLALGLAWGLARLLWGSLAAAIALLAIVASPVVLDQIVLFHNDVPSAAPVLALLLLLWWQLEVRERPNAFLLAAGPLAAAAFYLRFGALAVLVGVALIAVVLWARRLLREPRLVGATLVLALALFMPHIVQAVATTGTPLGIVRAAVTQVDTTTPVASAIQYIRWMPLQLAGIAGVVLIIAAGLAAAMAAVGSIRERRATPAARRLALLLVPASVAALGTVMVSHAEARYVLTPLILVEIAGAGAAAAAVARSQARLSRTRPRAAGLVVPGVLVGLVLVAAVFNGRGIRRDLQSARDQWLVEAGHAVAADAGGTCTVVSSIEPILGWYSGCRAISFADPADARTAAEAGMPVYVVFTMLDEQRGEKPAVLARYRNELDLVEIARIAEAQRSATVYRVVP